MMVLPDTIMAVPAQMVVLVQTAVVVTDRTAVVVPDRMKEVVVPDKTAVPPMAMLVPETIMPPPPLLVA
jgi:hypothetical protein